MGTTHNKFEITFLLFFFNFFCPCCFFFYFDIFSSNLCTFSFDSLYFLLSILLFDSFSLFCVFCIVVVTTSAAAFVVVVTVDVAVVV